MSISQGDTVTFPLAFHVPATTPISCACLIFCGYCDTCATRGIRN